MDADAVHAYLSGEFLCPHIADAWRLKDYSLVSPEFSRSSVGLMYDFASRVDRLFTAVFLSPAVILGLQRQDVSDALLVTHHPLEWTMHNYPAIFDQISCGDVLWLRERRIGVYVLHAPLDMHRRLGTSVALCDAIGLPNEGYVAGPHHFGVLSSSDAPLDALAGRVASAVGHRVSSYLYDVSLGASTPCLPGAAPRNLAVIAGGAANPDIIDSIADEGVSALITGVTRRSPDAERFHAAAQRRGVALIGATHYSSEKFACMRLAADAARLGIPTAFIEESPQFDDL